MEFKTCREELLYTVKQITSSRDNKEFTVVEVVNKMKEAGTTFKESTIRTHITSRCCVNAPSNHGTTYNDLERVKPGVYRLFHG